MQVTVTLTNGETLEVSPGFAEFVAFERHFDKPASALDDEDGGRLEWLAFLVHKAALREGADVPEDLDAFLAQVVAIDAAKEDDEDPSDGEAA